MKFNIKFFASLQFWLGLFLAGGAIVAFFVLGLVINPAPKRIVVVNQDIQRGDVVTQDKLAVTEQQLNTGLASYYVSEKELAQYLGAVAVEPFYKGDPLTKLRLAYGLDAETAKRLSAALADPDQVIRVIPVSPDICPPLYAGDVVEVGFSLGGQTAKQIGPTPTPGVRTYGQQEEEEASFDLPASKVILRDVLVLRVEREKVQNPNYGAGLSGDSASQPMYIEGEVERLIVLVEQADSELLDFAIHNGRLSIGLRAYTVRDEVEANLPQPSTLGVTWTDFNHWFLFERTKTISATLGLTGTEQVAQMPVPGAPSPAAAATIVTARSLDADHQPVEPTDVFGPQDTFYFATTLDVPVGTELVVSWTFAGSVIFEDFTTTQESPSSLWGKLTSSSGDWPDGEYQVVILDGTGQILARTAFQVLSSPLAQ